jgi:Condensation domain
MADDLSTRVAGPQSEQDPASRVREATEARIPRRAAGMERPPLSFAQEQLWFLDQFAPGQATYNIPMTLRLRGYLDAEALRMALVQLVRRHESLRTRFAAEDGVPYQVISPVGKVTLPIEDLTHLPPQEREAEAMRLANLDGAQPFDLQNDQLFRARLLRLSPEDHILSLIVHHIVSDGWSVGVLFEELGRVYGAIREEQVLAQVPLEVQYVDYAAWQREWLKSEEAESQLRYWERQLAGASVLELPTDRPRPEVPSGRGNRLIYRVSPELTDRLRELCKREGATLYMAMLAAFDILMAR